MQSRPRFGEGITGWAVENREPVWTNRAHLDPRSVTADQYLFNRLFLLAVGAVAFVLVAYRMRDEEQLLGFGEVKNG